MSGQSSRTPEEVFADHSARLATGDLDVVLENYAENAVFITPETVRHGREGVRKGLQQLIKDTPEAEWSLSHRTAGEVLLLMWTAAGPQFRIQDGVDTFVVRDGLIQAQTVSYTVQLLTGG